MPLITGSKSEAKMTTKRLHFKDTVTEEQLSREEVKAIRAWIDKQAHLPKLTDSHIVVFLHSCYYSIERTKETIDNYYTYRTHAPEIFCNRNPKTEVAKALKVVHFSTIPPTYKTADGYRVQFVRLRDADSSKFNFLEALRAAVAVFDMDVAQAPLAEGVLAVFDMKGITLGHIAKLNLSGLKKIMMYIQEALPLRLRGVHVLNTFPLINQIMALLKPLMKQELIDLIHFHSPSELDQFFEKYVPKSMMPSDYGGGLDSAEKLHDATCKRLLDVTDWLQELEQFKVVESKRTGKSKSASDVYGMEGSFKKLDLD